MHRRRPIQIGLIIAVWSQTWATAAGALGDEAAITAGRPPWTNARVIGSPEPPLPYRARRVMPELKLDRPVYAISEPGRNRLLVVEQGGRVLAISADAFADESTSVPPTQTFCELADHDFYGLTFHPDYAENGLVYVFANGPNSAERKQNRILRYRVSGEPPACDPDSRLTVIEWESNGHNGGDLAFGPDRMLYISSGDGTGDSDGELTGQDTGDLLSGILRIDVDHVNEDHPYRVPDDNPFVGLAGTRPELWAYGFRNPWRITFDPATGDLWVGDVGQDLWELVHLVRRGGNYGWSMKEGSRPFQPLRQAGPTPPLEPAIEHPHSEARSITGGLVYNGARFAELRGAYIYGDYATGKIWGARCEDGRITWRRELADTALQIVGFGADPQGELVIVDYVGGLYVLEPSPPAAAAAQEFPRRLSESGLFEDLANHRPHPGLVPYAVNAPLWSDGAAKERFIAVPDDGKIQFTENGAWQFPERSVLVKTFSLEVATAEGVETRRIETRLLKLEQGEWQGFSYRWNDEQTDAELVPDGGAELDLLVDDASSPDGKREQTWRFPSRAECMMCHTRAAGFVLGLNTLQMNRPYDHGGAAENQLARLARLGLLIGLEKEPAALDHLADPADETIALETRVRSLLHANCAHCHVTAGGGNSAIDLHFTTKLEAMRLVGIAPLHDRFDIADAQLAAPGEPNRSVLLHRVSIVDRGRMPPLATSVVDPTASRLISAWISELEALDDDGN